MDKKRVKKNDEIDKLKKELEEYKQRYLRALADYQNLEKRSIEEKEDYHSRFSETVLIKFLPIFDLVKKIKDLEPYKNDHAVQTVHKELSAVLEGYGLRGFPTKGLLFDPTRMECIEVVSVSDEKDDNKVLEEFVRGYTLNEKKLLRPAQVKVGKKEL